MLILIEVLQYLVVRPRLVRKGRVLSNYSHSCYGRGRLGGLTAVVQSSPADNIKSGNDNPIRGYDRGQTYLCFFWYRETHTLDTSPQPGRTFFCPFEGVEFDFFTAVNDGPIRFQISWVQL